MGRTFYARRKISCRLLSQDCRQALAQVRLPHRYRRIHQVLRVQHYNGVTKEGRGSGTIHPKLETKIEMRTTKGPRETACEIFRSDWWSSQRIPRIQKCQHPQTFLMTQIRNVPRKLRQGRTVPKDKNCEVCKRTKITRAPCRRRTGDAVPRAENVCDLTTADHKVLKEGGQVRNNHRYSVVVQDLANQWIQSYPCKTKTSQKTGRILRKFLEPSAKPKVIYTDSS